MGAANEARERERERGEDERFRESLRLFPLRSCSVLTLEESARLFFCLRGLIAPLGSSYRCAFSGCFFLPFQLLFSCFQIRCNLVQNRVDGDGARVKVSFLAATGDVVVVDKRIEYKSITGVRLASHCKKEISHTGFVSSSDLLQLFTRFVALISVLNYRHL